MGIGLDEIGDSAGALIDVPLRRSNAVSPLWWWAQAVPTLLADRLSLTALRVMPLCLGAASLILAFLAAGSRFGRGCAALYALFAAASDVLAFTHARGEYAETLLLLWVLPAVALTGDPRRTWLKRALWALMPLTHLGKGLFCVACLALADWIAGALSSRGRPAVKRALFDLGFALASSALWLGIAFWVASRGPLLTDIGEVRGPMDMLRALTLDYSATKAHMVRSPREALQPWLDPRVWPMTCVSGPLLLVGLAAAILGKGGSRGAVCRALLPGMGAAVALVVGRGMIGARFHLLYLPALWLAASFGLMRLGRAPRMQAVSRRTPAGLAVPLGLLAGGGALLLALSWGPIRWAPFSRFEPYAGSEERAAIEAHARGEASLPSSHGRTLYIDMANYFLTKTEPSDRDRRKAVHYAELETMRDPRDARAWYYLAVARRARGDEPGQILEAVRRSQELRPSEQAARLIQEFSAPATPSSP